MPAIHIATIFFNKNGSYVEGPLGPICFMGLLHKSQRLMGLKKQTGGIFWAKSTLEFKEKKDSREAFCDLFHPTSAGPVPTTHTRDPSPYQRAHVHGSMHACRGSRVIFLSYLMIFNLSIPINQTDRD